MALINPELVKLARFTVREGWAPSDAFEKAAIVPPGGGDPSGGGGGPPGGDPMAGGDPSGGGGPPPGGGGPPPGTAPPGAPPGGDPTAGGAPGGPPPGPLDPATLQQITMAVTQAVGGAGGPGGKGKSPKDQIQGSQMKILMHMVAQMASKMGVQVDPQMLVPPSDPASDQMAMSELQNTPMMPSMSPDAAGGAGGAPGGAPGGGAPPAGGGGGGGGAAGPGPVQPMDASQGPIGGKAAGFLGRPARTVVAALDDQEPIGQEYSIPKLRENRTKAAARLRLLQSLAR